MSNQVRRPAPRRWLPWVLPPFISLRYLIAYPGHSGDEAVDAGVTEERALETVTKWLSPLRLMELAAEAVDLYIWDRAAATIRARRKLFPEFSANYFPNFRGFSLTSVTGR